LCDVESCWAGMVAAAMALSQSVSARRHHLPAGPWLFPLSGHDSCSVSSVRHHAPVALPRRLRQAEKGGVQGGEDFAGVCYRLTKKKSRGEITDNACGRFPLHLILGGINFLLGWDLLPCKWITTQLKQNII
jgi:hypothetical protein